MTETVTDPESLIPGASKTRGPMSLLVPAISLAICAFCMFAIVPLTEASMTGIMIMFMGPMVAAAIFLIWWLFFTPTGWNERLLGVAGCGLAVVVFRLFAHPSARDLLAFYGIPALLLGWCLAIAIFRKSPPQRMAAAPLFMIVALAAFLPFRFQGMTGTFAPEFRLRWTKSAEEAYLETLAKSGAKKVEPAPAEPMQLAAGDWPAFRGPQRDSVVRGVKIRSDWKLTPPKEVWRSKIGPGWSGLTVVGNRIFTQEQRGEDEAVVCLNADTGAEVWAHADRTRFMEAVAGPGPRATPTFHEGKLYTVGANGAMNCFEAATGKLLWSHDFVKELDAKVPTWGFSASPLVQGDLVSVFEGATKVGVVAYKLADGKEAWRGGDGGAGYVSTHAAKVGGVDVLLNTTSEGMQALDPTTGKELWRHDWPCGEVARCTQPMFLNGGRIAFGTTFGFGTRVFEVKKAGDAWKTEIVDTHVTMKPYYNDVVTIGDEGYGFDGAIFSCVNLATGKRHWRHKPYGAGQVLLIADQKLLVVLAESGEVALVAADSAKFNELAKFRAIAGKTWNHPTIAHGKLFVRNGEEIACFDVSP